MMIIGCDLHTRYQQIAMLDTETGEEVERRLEHENGEARAFYSALQGRCEWGSKPPDKRTGSRAGWPRALDLAGITNTVGCPVLRVFCEGRESEMPAAGGFDRVSTTKSNSTRSIATRQATLVTKTNSICIQFVECTRRV